ncbi:hypothetical protein BK128_09620 [Viridibacillus sp. FSL H7-0596]|uniref:DUF3954 domain-containing protein n=1 Tax=Viridibacillus sp. FSL H7-0596 TaxID=1928923 RepID=UPI00096D68DF|nr:DUF3954 domain-containing protein [Viridibacillus sp. FSL H7-0596]OMC86914.1 hypothetical protein BK128_09620 [Viridibacillus sp. FSL H7-0596]
MGERKIDRDMIAEIDLHENGLYVVSDGLLTKVVPKSFGEDTITWQNNKVFEIKRTEKIRLNGQDMV